MGGPDSATRKRVLICFALREEAQFFATPAGCLHAVETLITGMGAANARRELIRRLDSSWPDLVLTCGFAGGLSPTLPVGSLIYEKNATPRLAALLARIGAAPAVLHCATRVAATAAEKRRLRESTGADAVEMESGVICGICNERDRLSGTLRVISDTASDDLPLDFNALMNERMELDYRRLAWALLRSPATVPALLRLRRKTLQAAQRLGTALRELLGQPDLCG